MLVIGHRGAMGHCPENTISSFEKAIELGAHMIELDVHVCASGELVVIHDETADRTTNGMGLISELSLNELKKLTINSSETIPTLSEVLVLTLGRCRINIELKGANTAMPMARELLKYQKDNNRDVSDILVSSFSQEELVAVRKLLPNIEIGVLLEIDGPSYQDIADKINARFINVDYRLLSRDLVNEVDHRNRQILAWTINDTESIKHAISLGVDGIFSDYPERILREMNRNLE